MGSGYKRRASAKFLTPGKLSTENRLPRKHDRRYVLLHNDKRIGGKSVRRTIWFNGNPLIPSGSCLAFLTWKVFWRETYDFFVKLIVRFYKFGTIFPSLRFIGNRTFVVFYSIYTVLAIEYRDGYKMRRINAVAKNYRILRHCGLLGSN